MLFANAINRTGNRTKISSSLLGGSYANLFTDYAKGKFLSAFSVLHRGFLREEKQRLVRTEVFYQMAQAVSAEKIGEFLRLGEPFRKFRNFDQHRENPNHPQVWSLIADQAPFLICIANEELIDPFPITRY